MSSDGALIRDNVELLRQGIALVARMDDASYASGRAPVSVSGVGGHMRHCLDFYQSFLGGIRTGWIDYDSRARNERIERDRAAATHALETAIDSLESLLLEEGPELLRVRSEDPQDDAGPTSWSVSSRRRELQFLASHTVHHYALIASLLRRAGLEPAGDFGVAPSTLRQWRRTA